LTRVFADSCFIIGLKNKKDQFAGLAREVWTELARRKIVNGLEDLVVTNLVVVEVFQKLQNDVGFARAHSVFKEIMDNCAVEWVTESQVREAIAMKLAPTVATRRDLTKEPPIGLIDAVSLVVMDKTRVRFIISYDKGYDEIPLVRRLYNKKSVSMTEFL